MNLSNITIGADPELFIINERTRKVVSAVELIPGEKGDPWRSEDMPEGFGIETDNILAEFNIPPVKTREAFVNSIQYMQNYIDRFVKNINPELGIKCVASRIVPSSELTSKQAQQFGCEIDYNVYTQSANPKPEGTNTNLRSAGFHLHCGYDKPNIDTSLMLIRYFDAYIGVPSILRDKDTKRRSLYGKAGSFRLCDYGFEYRTLSSAMMSSTTKLNFIWRQIQNALDAYNDGTPLPDPNDVQEAINSSNIDIARKLISTYNLE